MRRPYMRAPGRPGYMVSTQLGLRQLTGRPLDATMTDMPEVAVVGSANLD